jgi:hypothetical protein
MNYTLTLTEQHIHTLAAGLAELPYKIAQPVLIHIQAQLDTQLGTTKLGPEPLNTAVELGHNTL